MPDPPKTFAQPIQNVVVQLEADIRAALADGHVTAIEMFTMLFSAISKLVHAVEAAEGMTGPEKKAAVMEALEYLYDRYFVPLDLPGPDGILDPAFKILAMGAMDAGIEWCLSFIPKE